MHPIASRLEQLNSTLPEGVTLVAVSKKKPVSDIRMAYECGQRDFGENYIQELQEKQPQLPEDIRWHFIGHLQRNKVKYIAPYVHLIHGVDSLRLLKEIDKQAAKNERVIDVLLQFHIAEETSKFGLDMTEAHGILNDPAFGNLQNIRIKGVMGMATLTRDHEQIAREFSGLRNIYSQLREHPAIRKPQFTEISMGMSSDYLLAIECGSTMVRVGSKIFGERN